MDLFELPPAKPEPESRPILLPLSLDEAQAIQAVFAHVGGHPGESPRGFVDLVAQRLIVHVGSPTEAVAALYDAGFEIDASDEGVCFSYPGETA